MEATSADFEVFGKVQGCNFTKFAQEKAAELVITGYVKNAKTGTIQGRIQGTKDAVDKMIKWLSTEGSPGCNIDRCEITNSKAIMRPDYPKFTLKF